MGNCLKRGAWTVCRFKRGLSKKKGMVFVSEGVDTPMHTIACLSQSTFYVSAIIHLLDPLCCKDFSNTFYIYCMTLAKCNCFAFSLNKNISSQLVEQNKLPFSERYHTLSKVFKYKTKCNKKSRKGNTRWFITSKPNTFSIQYT